MTPPSRETNQGRAFKATLTNRPHEKQVGTVECPETDIPQGGFADFHSKARSGRQGISAVCHPHGGKTEQIFPHTIHLACLDETANLLTEKVRNCCIHVQTRNSAHRSLACVWSNAHPGRFGRSSRLPQCCYSANMSDIGLEYIDNRLINQFGKAVRSNETFPGRDRGSGSSGCASHSRNVFRRTDFFGKQQMIRFNLAEYDRGHSQDSAWHENQQQNRHRVRALPEASPYALRPASA